MSMAKKQNLKAIVTWVSLIPSDTLCVLIGEFVERPTMATLLLFSASFVVPYLSSTLAAFFCDLILFCSGMP